MKKHQGNTSPRTLFGIALIALAVMILLNNIGFGFVSGILRHWPVGLVIIGIILLVGPHKQQKAQGTNAVLPYILIGLGILFFLAQHHILNFSIGALIVPVILLIIGINVLKAGRSKPLARTDADNLPADAEFDGDAEAATEASSITDDNSIDIFTVLGGGDFVTRSTDLSSGNIVAVLGGADVDLRDADTQEAPLQIDVVAFMGGIEIKVPPHWQVTVKAIPFLGGVSNKTSCLAEKLGVPKKHLVITGLAVMGGVDIRN